MTVMDTERNESAPQNDNTCPRCKGKGHFDDVRTASITHRVTAIRRKCRNCKGTGEKPQPAAVSVEPPSEIPDWMLGLDDDSA